MNFQEAEANLKVISKVYFRCLFDQNPDLYSIVRQRKPSPFREITTIPTGFSAEQFNLFFRKIIKSVGEAEDGNTISIGSGMLGILFQKVVRTPKQGVIISSITKEENPLDCNFRMLFKSDELGTEGNWIPLLYDLVGENNLWLKAPVPNASILYVGGFRTMEATSEFLVKVCDSELPFTAIGVLALKWRPWYGELEFPGKYAIMIAYV